MPNVIPCKALCSTGHKMRSNKSVMTYQQQIWSADLIVSPNESLNPKPAFSISVTTSLAAKPSDDHQLTIVMYLWQYPLTKLAPHHGEQSLFCLQFVRQWPLTCFNKAAMSSTLNLLVSFCPMSVRENCCTTPHSIMAAPTAAKTMHQVCTVCFCWAWSGL